MLLNIRQLMEDARCYEVVRELRWPGRSNPLLPEGIASLLLATTYYKAL